MVRLIRFTLQEYLQAHFAMEETGPNYLDSQNVMALYASPSPKFQDTLSQLFFSVLGGSRKKGPFILCRRAGADSAQLEYNNHISTEVLSKTRKSYFYAVGLINKKILFKGLHCAPVFGIVEITAGSGGGML